MNHRKTLALLVALLFLLMCAGCHSGEQPSPEQKPPVIPEEPPQTPDKDSEKDPDDWDDPPIVIRPQDGSTHVSRDVSVKRGVTASRYNGNPYTEQEKATFGQQYSLPPVSVEESAAKIDGLGIGWYYNWGSTTVLSTEAEFVPMCWGTWDVNESNLKQLKDGYLAGEYKNLLTFNEPDGDFASGGCQTSVEDALSVWPKLESIGIPLGSPAPANYYNGWLDSFMNAAEQRGYRVDFVALHFYQDFSNPASVGNLKKQLTEIYEKYQKPIWLTEFGAIDIAHWAGQVNPGCTESAATRYVKEAAEMLESLGFVERYSWFLDHFRESVKRIKEAPYTCLYTDNGSLSATGKVYSAISSAQGLEITVKSIPAGKRGMPYYAQFSGAGGTGKYIFNSAYPVGVSAIGVFPKGLTLSRSGMLYGTPSVSGSYKICVTMTDEKGQMTFRIYALTVF